MSMMKGRVSRPAFLFATPPVDPGVTTHTGPNLFAFCLRLACIEFVYILFSHSPLSMGGIPPSMAVREVCSP